MKANYAKLQDGSWGVRLTKFELGEFRAGESLQVQVVKKSGESKLEDIKVFWAGKTQYGACALARIERASGGYSRPRFDEDEGSSWPCHVCGKFCFSGEHGYCPEERG